MSAHGGVRRGHWISELELEKFLHDARVYGCLQDCNTGAGKRTLVFKIAQVLLTARPYLLSKLIYHFYIKEWFGILTRKRKLKSE